MPKEAKKSLRSLATRSTAGSEFGGSQTSYARSNRSSLPNREVAHSRENTCESCRLWTGRLKDTLWETCLRVDPTVKDCTNRPRRTKRKKNLCQSCLINATTSHQSYVDICQNPNSTVDNCLETPLVTTNSQAGGFGRELGEDTPEGDVAVRSSCGGDQVAGEEFAGLMRDLDALDFTGRFAVPSDWHGTMPGSTGGAGNHPDYGNMMMELDDLDPHGTVAEPSGGIVDFMTYFNEHVTEHGTLRDP